MENAEFIKEFIEEATGHLDAVEVGLLQLEKGSFAVETIHDVFRAVHSIKGTAGFFSLGNIVELSHAMENLLGEIREGSLQISGEVIQTLLSANDCLREMVGDINGSESIDLSDHLAKIERIMLQKSDVAAENMVQQKEQSPETKRRKGVVKLTGQQLTRVRQAVKQGQLLQEICWQTDSMLIDVESDNVPEIVKKINSIGQIITYTCEADTETGEYLVTFLVATVLEKALTALALGIAEECVFEKDLTCYGEGRNEAEVCHHSVDMDEYAQEVTAEKGMNPRLPVTADDASNENMQPIAADETIRVPVPLLNDLLNLASEMVLGRNQLLRLAGDQRKETDGLSTVLQNIDNITTELQEKILLTRMQPLARVFNKFPRIIRELSSRMNKEIELQLKGMDVELDKSMIETLLDPLTHLVRNAADHGIEPPDEREENGKNRAGTITLSAYHEGGHVNIDIIDNGKGMDIAKIKDQAIKNKLISPVEAESMSEQELLALLFRPGFSTATEITDFSGRGVGMDVVKTNIEKLGGVMEIMTVLGQGSTVRLTLPLTLAIIPSIIVEVSGQKFALPQVNLQEMVRIKSGDDTKKIESFQEAMVFRLRGKLIPIIQLSKVLGLSSQSLDEKDIVRILIIKSGSKRFGLIVDCIHDGEEILVKHLPKYLANCRCYSGVTILGDGRIATILDPEGIAVKAGIRFVEEDQESVGTAFQGQGVANELQNLLLFKCCGPETFSIDLNMVGRVEKVPSSSVEVVGDKEFIQFRNEALRVIRPQNYYPVNRQVNNKEYLFVIIPKLVKYPIGLLAEEIIDNIETKICFNQDDIKAQGLVGSAMLNNRFTLIINLYELYEMVAPEHYRAEISLSGTAAEKVVLLAEDTPLFAKLEKQYLEQAGYQVLMAFNGREAWEILQENHVDVLVSDIEMPLMNGYELIKRVRADSKLSALPAIAVTSKTDKHSVNKGLTLGFDFYEVKLDKENLLNKVSSVLEKKQ